MTVSVALQLTVVYRLHLYDKLKVRSLDVFLGSNVQLHKLLHNRDDLFVFGSMQELHRALIHTSFFSFTRKSRVI